MQIYGVSFDMVGKQPIVLLKTVDGNRFLPIWIGHPEAAAILMKLQGASTPRPMTHDLVADMLEQLDAQVIRITVTELKESTFYASITVQQNGSEVEIDSRPSDAIALAVRAEPPGREVDRRLAARSEKLLELLAGPEDAPRQVRGEHRPHPAGEVAPGDRVTLPVRDGDDEQERHDGDQVDQQSGEASSRCKPS